MNENLRSNFFTELRYHLFSEGRDRIKTEIPIIKT